MIPCILESLPLISVGITNNDITKNITGISTTRDVLTPFMAELCGMAKGDKTVDTPLTSTRLNKLAPITLPSDNAP